MNMPATPVPQILDTLCPMHAVIDSTGHVVHAGPTLRKLRADIREQVKARVDTRLAAGQRAPGLAVVLVGENPASQVYVRNKVKKAEAIGAYSEKHELQADATQEQVLELVLVIFVC